MLKNISVKVKLYLIAILIAVILVILGGTSIDSLNRINDSTSEITDKWMARVDIAGNLDTAISEYRKEQLGFILAVGQERIQYRENNLKKIDTEITKNLEAYRNLMSDPVRIKNLEDMMEKWESYKRHMEPVLMLRRQGKIEEARIEIESSINEFESITEKIKEMKEYSSQGGIKANADADETFAFSFKLLWGIVIFAILCVGSILTLFIRMLTRRLDYLVHTINKFADGDMKERLVISSTDELSKVGMAVNKMGDNLRDLLNQIQKTSSQLAASSEELTASADQSTQVTQQIANSVTDVAELSTNQLTAVTATTSVIEQISAGVEETSATATMAAEHSQKAVGAARDGNVAVNHAVTAMKRIEETVQQSAGVVAKLGDRSKEIGQIVDTISGIAGQTNLLALNAAIEAARAGEMGKGFAVVAEEVRKLAEQSQEAAEKIAVLIEDIQTDTDKAVVSMKAGTQEVEDGTQVIGTAGSHFGRILEMVEAVNGQACDIAKTMEELAGGTQNIVTSVQEVDSSSKEVAAEAQAVSAATEEQSASMEQIAASSRSLAELAQELQQATTKFRL